MLAAERHMKVSPFISSSNQPFVWRLFWIAWTTHGTSRSQKVSVYKKEIELARRSRLQKTLTIYFLWNRKDWRIRHSLRLWDSPWLLRDELLLTEVRVWSKQDETHTDTSLRRPSRSNGHLFFEMRKLYFSTSNEVDTISLIVLRVDHWSSWSLIFSHVVPQR